MKRVLVVTAMVVAAITGVVAQNDRQDQDPHVIALHKAIRANDFDKAFEILPSITDVEYESAATSSYEETTTTLGLAASNGFAKESYALAKSLIEKHGASPIDPDSQGLTPLHHASSTGSLAVVDLLLKYGADLNAKVENPNHDYNGYTPLHLAISNLNDPVAEALRSYGAVEPSREFVEKVKSQRIFADEYTEVLEKLAGNADGDGAPQDVIQSVYEDASRAMIRMFERNGRPDQAAQWRDFNPEQLGDILVNNPRPQSDNPLDATVWASQVLLQIAKEVEAGGQAQ